MGVGYHLKACGKRGLPETIPVNGRSYRLRQVYKHDFFAATARYSRDSQGDSPQTDSNAPASIILKMNRESEFLGLPLAWLGEWMSRRESDNLRLLRGLAGVPHYIGRHGRCGLVYEYVAGQTLDARPPLPEDFFDQLAALVEEIHRRRIAYMDLNKRGNIIVGADGRPFLIDFQIAWHAQTGLPLLDGFLGVILRKLQKEDFYHLSKHKRRFRPDLMSQQEILSSRQVSLWVTWHRLWTRPLIQLRRKILGFLYRKGHIVNDVAETHPETDPSRWVKEQKKMARK